MTPIFWLQGKPGGELSQNDSYETAVRRDTYVGTPSKERERNRGGGHKVRALCEPLAPATEMKVSLNNPVKCSDGAEIPLRGSSV